MVFVTRMPGGTADGTSVTLAAELLINTVSTATDSRTITAANANALSLNVDESEGNA